MVERIEIRFVEETLADPRHIILDGGPDHYVKENGEERNSHYNTQEHFSPFDATFAKLL